MRSTVLSAAAAVLLLSPLMVAGPVAADTQCRDVDMGNTVVRKSCKIDSSRIGGLVEGGIYWDYKHGSMGQSGEVVLDARDRTADGKCTIVKIKYRDRTKNPNPPETRKWRFCNGRSGPVRATLNQGQSGAGSGAPDGGPFPIYRKGRYIVEHCSGRKFCDRLWSQDVSVEKDPR